MKKQKIVIDTDVGTDCDDLFALAYAIKNPKADIKAITTVHGKTEIRAKIVRKLCKMLDVDIPIIVGEEKPLSGNVDYWCGFEHLILTDKEKAEPIEKREFPVYDKDTNLVCIGPLTNIALQLENNPSIKKVNGVYVMGSSLTSHNFVADLEATKRVFAEPWHKIQITKEVSKKIGFEREELEFLKGNKLGNFLYDSAKLWLDYKRKNKGNKKAVMYDVLTVSAALGEDFVKLKEEDDEIVSYDVDLKLKDKIMEVIK